MMDSHTSAWPEITPASPYREITMGHGRGLGGGSLGAHFVALYFGLLCLLDFPGVFNFQWCVVCYIFPLLMCMCMCMCMRTIGCPAVVPPQSPLMYVHFLICFYFFFTYVCP